MSFYRGICLDMVLLYHDKALEEFAFVIPPDELSFHQMLMEDLLVPSKINFFGPFMVAGSTVHIKGYS